MYIKVKRIDHNKFFVRTVVEHSLIIILLCTACITPHNIVSRQNPNYRPTRRSWKWSTGLCNCFYNISRYLMKNRGMSGSGNSKQINGILRSITNYRHIICINICRLTIGIHLLLLLVNQSGWRKRQNLNCFSSIRNKKAAETSHYEPSFILVINLQKY